MITESLNPIDEVYINQRINYNYLSLSLSFKMIMRADCQEDRRTLPEATVAVPVAGGTG